MKIKDVEIGQRVQVEGVVMMHNGSQTLLWVPGIGESGQWSIVNTADCRLVRGGAVDPFVLAMLQAWRASNAEVRRLRGLGDALGDGEQG